MWIFYPSVFKFSEVNSMKFGLTAKQVDLGGKRGNKKSGNTIMNNPLIC